MFLVARAPPRPDVRFRQGSVLSEKQFLDLRVVELVHHFFAEPVGHAKEHPQRLFAPRGLVRPAKSDQHLV